MIFGIICTILCLIGTACFFTGYYYIFCYIAGLAVIVQDVIGFFRKELKNLSGTIFFCVAGAFLLRKSFGLLGGALVGAMFSGLVNGLLGFAILFFASRLRGYYITFAGLAQAYSEVIF